MEAFLGFIKSCMMVWLQWLIGGILWMIVMAAVFALAQGLINLLTNTGT